MFCIKCGSEIPEDDRFCIKCGTKAVLPQAAEPQEAQAEKQDAISLEKPASTSAMIMKEPMADTQQEAEQTDTQEIQDCSIDLSEQTDSLDALQNSAPEQETIPMRVTPDQVPLQKKVVNQNSMPRDTGEAASMHDALLEKIVHKNVSYYKTHFEELTKGGRNRMNWAALFLGLFHASYRNMWKEWLKFVWKPLALYFGIGIIGVVMISSDLTFIIPVVLASLAAGVLLFVTGIRYGKSFNKLYMNHVEQKIAVNDTKIDPSIGRMVAVIAVSMVIQTIVTISSGTFLMARFFSSFDDLDTDVWEQESAIIEEMPEQMPEQIPPQTPDMPPVQSTAQTSPLLKDYTGSWMVDRYNNFIDGYVGFDLVEYNGTLYFSVNAVWNQGDRVTNIPQIALEMNHDGTGGGAPYEDDRGNMGDVMLLIEDGAPYLTVTVRGDSHYGIEMQHERCSRAEEQTDAPLEITEAAYENYIFYNEDDGHTYSYGIGSVEELAGYSLDSRYLWPSDQLEISDGPLNDITQTEIAALRNEIFARHGYIFSSPEWDAFFRTAVWYVPDAGYSESMLNETEKKNLAIITEYERSRGWK